MNNLIKIVTEEVILDNVLGDISSFLLNLYCETLCINNMNLNMRTIETLMQCSEHNVSYIWIGFEGLVKLNGNFFFPKELKQPKNVFYNNENVNVDYDLVYDSDDHGIVLGSKDKNRMKKVLGSKNFWDLKIRIE